jgi:predicted MFS family arabinose efflux permease
MTGPFCKALPRRLSLVDVLRAVVSTHMRSAIWIGIFVGSTIGGFIPALWGDDMLSYSGVLLSGVGAFVGLWLGSRASR